MIFDRDLNVRKVVAYSQGRENNLSILLGVCFDDEGNAYIVGAGGVAKFDKGGNFLATVNRVVEGGKIACVGGRVYAFVVKRVDNYLRHILYMFDKDLKLLSEHVLSKGVEADSWFSLGKPAFDGKNLYVAGYDYALGDKRIVVYSISLPTTTQITSPTTPEAITALTTAHTANSTSQTRPATKPLPLLTQPAGAFSADDFVAFAIAAVAAVAVAAAFAVVKLRQRALSSPTRMWVGSVEEAGGFCLEHHGGVVPLSTYTVVGRKDFPGLPEEALAKIEERHFAVYFKDGEWWVEDLGSRYGTYLNGIRVKKARLKDGDVISAGVVVTLVFKQCGAMKRVIVEGD